MPSCPFGQHFSHPPRIFLTTAFLKLISSHSSRRDAGQVLLLFQSHLHFGAMSVLAQRSSFWSLLRVDSLGHAVDLSAIGNEWGLHLSLNFSCPRVRVSYCPCIGIAYWLARGGVRGLLPFANGSVCDLGHAFKPVPVLPLVLCGCSHCMHTSF